jgi:hypothetical protein
MRYKINKAKLKDFLFMLGLHAVSNEYEADIMIKKLDEVFR